MKSLYLAGAALALIAGQAYADPINQPPPVGTVIYQLTGQTISNSYQVGTASFVADSAATNLTFAFREDPAFIELSDVSMTDTTTGDTTNLVLNGDFSLGPVGASAPTDWDYLNQFGATFGGTVQAGCGVAGANCYDDGAVQAYDAINQVIATTVGDTYQVSFSYLDTDGDGSLYQPVSTNGDVTGTGGNGRDMFVYAASTIPVRAPEPASLALLGAGLLGLGMIRRRKA